MGNRGTNLYLSFETNMEKRIEQTVVVVEGKLEAIKVYSVFLRNKEITLRSC